MELHKLRAFTVVAEELNFRRSAEILRMSQPPLTRLIASLEEDLSTPLFERTTRQVKLTSAGVYLLKEAREILAKVEVAKKETRLIGKIRSGSIKIGFSTTSFLARLPSIIEQFKMRSPNLKLELHQGSRRRILSDLRNGRLDVAFAEGSSFDSECASQVIKDEVLGVLLPKKHRLSRRKTITVADLEDETIIMHPRSDHQEFFDNVRQLFAQNGISPRIYIKKEGESCPFLVSLGAGVHLGVEGTRNKSPEDTCFVPLEKMQMPVSVVWLPQNENSLLKSFLSFACS